jgi:hypothetical protein
MVQLENVDLVRGGPWNERYQRAGRACVSIARTLSCSSGAAWPHRLQFQGNLSGILIEQIAPVRSAVRIVCLIGRLQSLAAKASDFGTFDFEKVRAWPRTVGRGVGAAFEMAGLLGRNSFPSPGRG